MTTTNAQHGSGRVVGGLASSQHSTSNSISVPPPIPSQTKPNINVNTNVAPSSASPNHGQTRQQQQQQRQFTHFIIRPNVTKYTASGTVTLPGPIVPLIAVDQLPEGLGLLGVPRELSLEETIGLVNLGTVARRPDYYQLYRHNGDNEQLHQKQQEQQQQQLQHQYQQHHITAEVNARRMSSVASPLLSPSPSLSSSAASVAELAAVPNTGMAAISHATNLPLPPSPRPTPRLDPQHQRQLEHHLQQHQHQQQHQPPPPPPPQQQPTRPSHPQPERMLPSWYPPGTPTTTAPAPALPNPYHKSNIPISTTTTQPPTTATTTTSSPHPTTTTTTTSTPHPTPPSSSTASSNDTSRKSCKYWCRTGNCKWGTQCNYAHLMPHDVEGLREVGLTAPPKWYLKMLEVLWGTNGAMGGRGGVNSGGRKGGKDNRERKGGDAGKRSSVLVSRGGRETVQMVSPVPVRQVGGYQGYQNQKQQSIEHIPVLAPTPAPVPDLVEL